MEVITFTGPAFYFKLPSRLVGMILIICCSDSKDSHLSIISYTRQEEPCLNPVMLNRIKLKNNISSPDKLIFLTIRHDSRRLIYSILNKIIIKNTELSLFK